MPGMDSPTSNGLGHIFSKNRQKDRKKRDSATNSIASTESDGLHLRASLESAIDKIKGQDEDGGLKKLMPKSLGSRRRKKKQEQEDELRASEEAARGRDVAERGTLENDIRGGVFRAHSDGSSLITYDDSEVESPLEIPPLTTHPSHIGYLTTSSPLVQSTSVPDISEGRLDGHVGNRATTFPTSSDNLATSTSESSLVSSNTLQTPVDGSRKRSPSPGRRLKEALRPGRSGPSPESSPDGKGRKGGVEQLLKGEKTESRRGSVASRIGSIFPDKSISPDKQPPTNSSPERPRTAKIKPIDTTPRTPPTGESAPIIVNTPPTPTDSGTSRFPNLRDRGTSDPVVPNPNVIISPSGNMISHRRVRSGSSTVGPSKLSNITSAPLTPTPEIGSTTPNSQSGFFSSVFSAAQNAANTLSNSIANTTLAPGAKVKGIQQDHREIESPEVETLAEAEDDQSEDKELAVKTLGMGDLNLSHLGISESSIMSDSSSKLQDENRARSESTGEDLQGNQVLPVNGFSGDNIDIQPIAEVEDVQSVVRPRSVYEPSMGGEQTPPNGSVFEGKSSMVRSGSIRSAMGSRRKRGSSAATGASAIGAAIAAAHSSVANPNAPGAGPKITGFAVASKKRNRDFHQLFRSVPDDDYLIEDYSCALQREILAHGRLYVSEGHLCFSSNIFGWVTTLVMSFDEIVSVEKRSTALVFKNGLMISTLHAKNIFASFTSRDSTYDLIVGIWKLGHPSLRSSLNGVRIEETGGGDKTEKDDGTVGIGSPSGSDSESEGEGDEIYDEDDDDEDDISFAQAEGSLAGSDVAEKPMRKPSAVVPPSGVAGEKKEDTSANPSADFPGPATHAPTECTDQETHFSKVLADEVVSAPLGKVYSLMFGPASVTWMRNWLTVDQKCFELTIEGDSKKPLGLDNKVRYYSYIKPLNGSIGPKQTKCICTETLDSLDLEKAVSVTISTQTPDVPSGNVFSVKTKYCLTWAEGNGTRIQMNCFIEWTGKSWLKGPIEKGANDGQVQYAKDILASLKTAVSSRRGTLVAPAGKKGKKGRKRKDSKSISKTTDGASDTKPEEANWGLLEPLRKILSPFISILRPLTSGNMMYGLLIGLLVASWFRFGFRSRNSRDDSSWANIRVNTPERIAAYEEIWRREESELWKWLEERAGLDRLQDVAAGERQLVRDRLRNEKMLEREVDHAIRVTEERLGVLKDVVSKEKSRKKAEEPAPPSQKSVEVVKQEGAVPEL